MRRTWFAKSALFAWFVYLFTVGAVAADEQDPASQARELAQFYFASDPGYHAGDLISQSQLEEFQTFLRKTRRYSKLTHVVLLKLTLSDDAPLVRLFHSQGGAGVFRTAAAELGSYAPIDRTTLREEGRVALREAVSADSPKAVLEAVAIYAPQESEKPDARHLLKDRIYTVEDLINRVFSSE